MKDLDVYVTLIVIAAVLLLLFVVFIRAAISSRKEHRRLWEKMASYDEGPELDEIGARIIAKACFTQMYGSKPPQMCREFYVTFLTDMGEERRFSVLEEIYLSVEEGDEGTLATLNGNFYGFDKA